MTAGAVEQPRRHELALFVLLAFAISWTMHIPLALATLRSGDPTASTGSPLNLLAPWGPAVAAIIVTTLVMGRRGPGTLFRQLRVWRVGIWWYLIAVLLPAGLWLVGRALDTLLGRSYTVESVATDPDLAPYLAVFLIGAFIYTLGEELGWRAYALPRLQQHRSALIAALVIGVLWGLWHVPTFIAQGHTGPDLVPLVMSPIAASVLFTWVYNSTGGSLLLVWVFHTASTITGYLLGELPMMTDELVGVAAAVVVVLAAGPTDLSRSRPRQRLSATPAPQPHPRAGPEGEPLCAAPGPGDPSRERWLAAMCPIEPISFIGLAAPAALLFQAGTKDELIPQEDARRYQQAASQPKEVRWYAAGHELNCTAREDMMAWLARHIRIHPERYACRP